MQWFFEAGATAFVRAAQSSDIELLKLLLAHGADPKMATDYGDTALTAAGGIGWVEGVHLRALAAGEPRSGAACCWISASIPTTRTLTGARR